MVPDPMALSVQPPGWSRDALGHVSHHRELAYDPRCGGEYST